MFLNQRPDTYEVEIVVVEQMHSSENIQFIQKVDDVITLHGYDEDTIALCIHSHSQSQYTPTLYNLQITL